MHTLAITACELQKACEQVLVGWQCMDSAGVAGHGRR